MHFSPSWTTELGLQYTYYYYNFAAYKPVIFSCSSPGKSTHEHAARLHGKWAELLRKLSQTSHLDGALTSSEYNLLRPHKKKQYIGHKCTTESVIHPLIHLPVRCNLNHSPQHTVCVQIPCTSI